MEDAVALCLIVVHDKKVKKLQERSYEFLAIGSAFFLFKSVEDGKINILILLIKKLSIFIIQIFSYKLIYKIFKKTI